MSEEAVNETVINEDVKADDAQASNADALSFDDLDELTDDRSDSEILKEAIDANKEESKGEENQSEAKEESTKEKTSQESKEDEEEAEIQEEIKKYLGKSGDNELEVNADTMFTHKVEGQDVDVSLQELLQNYAGKVPYDRRYQELDVAKKDFNIAKDNYENEVKAVNKYINDFAEKVKGGDPLGALSYFAEFSGMKPYEFKDALINQLAPEVDRLRNLTPEEYRQEQLNSQNEYSEKLHKSEAERRQHEQSEWELKKEIQGLQQTYGIGDSDFENAYYAIKESDYQGEISPQTVVDYIQYNRSYDKAEEILSQVNPELIKQESVVDALQEEILRYPDWTNEQLLEVVKDAFGATQKKVSQSVSNKVQSAPKKQKEKQEREKEQYLSFDDL